MQVLVAGEPTAYYCIGATRLNLDQWYYLAAVLTPTTLSVFADGVQDGTVTIPSGYSVITPTDGEFLGQWNSAAFLSGNLFDFRVSGDARSAGGAAHTRGDDLLTFPAIGHRESHPPRRLVLPFFDDVVHFALTLSS